MPIDKETAVILADSVFLQSAELMSNDLTEWTIHGYNGTELVLDERVRSRDLPAGGMAELLRRLVCKDLSAHEVVASTTGASPPFDLSRTKDGWMTGGNPRYIANRVERVPVRP